MGRRGTKEFRPAEALQLILADRDRESLTCPSCGHRTIDRTPKRRVSGDRWTSHRQIALRCAKCGRTAKYVPGSVTQPSHPQLL